MATYHALNVALRFLTASSAPSKAWPPDGLLHGKVSHGLLRGEVRPVSHDGLLWGRRQSKPCGLLSHGLVRHGWGGK